MVPFCVPFCKMVTPIRGSFEFASNTIPLTVMFWALRASGNNNVSSPSKKNCLINNTLIQLINESSFWFLYFWQIFATAYLPLVCFLFFLCHSKLFFGYIKRCEWILIKLFFVFRLENTFPFCFFRCYFSFFCLDKIISSYPILQFFRLHFISILLHY